MIHFTTSIASRSRLSRFASVLTLFIFTSCSKDPASSLPVSKHEHTGADEHGHSESDEKHADEVVLTSEAIEQNKIQLAKAEKQTLTPTFLAPGRVAFNAEAMAHIGTVLRGRIVDIAVKVGDEVKKDQPLLAIESAELGEGQSDYLVKRAATKSAAPAIELARTAFNRAQALYEKSQGISLNEVQKREADLRAAEAIHTSAKAAEEAAKERLALLRLTSEAVTSLEESSKPNSKFIIRAPIDGRIIEREATLGEPVGPDREALLLIADMAKLWVIADVPESRLRDVVLGAKARVLLGGGQAHWCEGTVSFISPALDVATRTVRVRIAPNETHPELRPGVFAQAEIAIKALEGAVDPFVVVPEEAIQTVEGKPAVFVPVAGEKNTFAKRSVVIGKTVGGLVPILSGLSANEDFVAKGSFILKAELGKGSAEHEH